MAHCWRWLVFRPPVVLVTALWFLPWLPPKSALLVLDARSFCCFCRFSIRCFLPATFHLAAGCLILSNGSTHSSFPIKCTVLVHPALDFSDLLEGFCRVVSCLTHHIMSQLQVTGFPGADLQGASHYHYCTRVEAFYL